MDLMETFLMHVSTTGALLAAVLLFLVAYLISISSRKRSSGTHTTATAGKPAPTGSQTTSREPLGIVQKIRVSVQSAFWTQEGCGSGWIQDGQTSTCEPGRRIRGKRHYPHIPGLQSRMWNCLC